MTAVVAPSPTASPACSQDDWKTVQKCIARRRHLRYRLIRLRQPSPQLAACASNLTGFCFMLSRDDLREEGRILAAIQANEELYLAAKARLSLAYDEAAGRIIFVE
jgi:hypothetical protein